MEKIIFRNSTNVKFQQLKHAIGKDKFRPIYSGVFLDVHFQKLVVTNSQVLVAYDVEIIEDGGVGEVLIDPKIFNSSNWLSVPKEDLHLVEFHVTEEKTEVRLGDDIVAVAKNIDCDVVFPQWKHVFNDKELNPEFIAFNSNLKALLNTIPNGFPLPKFKIGSKFIFEAVQETEGGEVRVEGLAMTASFETDNLVEEWFDVEVQTNESGVLASGVADKLIGQTLAKRVLNTWKEDFINEDNGEVVSLDRNEIIIDRNVVIDAEIIDELIKYNIKKVSIFNKKHV